MRLGRTGRSGRSFYLEARKGSDIYQIAEKCPTRTKAPTVGSHWMGRKNCQTKTSGQRNGSKKPATEDKPDDPSAFLQPCSGLESMCVLFLQVNLTELKVFPNPPNAVTNVTAAVMVLLAPQGRVPKDRSWKAAKVFMGKVSAWQDENPNDFCAECSGYV